MTAKIDFEASKITISDGQTLRFSQWGFENSPKSIIVALHGMNDYGNSFAFMGDFLAKHNIATLAYDARHFGRNENRGDWAAPIRMAQDFVEIIATLKDAYQNSQIILLGDSMGGSTILSSYFNNLPHKADKVILIAPGVAGWTTQPKIYRFGLWLINKFAPKKPLTPPKIVYKTITASDNSQMLNQIGHDENMIWHTKPQTLQGLLDMMEQAFKAAKLIGNVPTMILFAGRDQIIPPAASARFAIKLQKHIEVKLHKNAYHMMLRDNERENYFKEISDFIQRK